MSPPIDSTLEKAHRGTGQGRGWGIHGEQGQGHQKQHVGMNVYRNESWIELYITSHQDTLEAITGRTIQASTIDDIG
jgi:hypothetical protein